jgi:plastocyanin
MLKQSSNGMKKVMFILLAVLLAASVTAVAENATSTNGVSSTNKIIDISMKNAAYNPKSGEISVGDTVKWTNMDSIDHGVEGSIFKSGVMSPGQSYEFQFTTPGVYNYKCPLHPADMTGTITVVANSSINSITDSAYISNKTIKLWET